MPSSIAISTPAPTLVWLLPVVPRLEPISPEIDRILGKAALAAIAGDVSARDALFTAFHPRFERSIRRCQRLWTGQSRQSIEDAIEPEDIAQEAYLVFVDLLQTWPGSDSVSAYLCARFPWRLNDATRAWRRPRIQIAGATLRPDSALEDTEVAVLIDELTADLQPGMREMLRQRVFERLTFQEIARSAGVSKRTISRRWEGLVRELGVTRSLEIRPK